MVTNPARQETDSLLEDLEKRIAKEYSQAADELQKKADKYFQGFAERDAKKKALVESGELTEKEYIRWRRGALQHGRRYEDMIADLTNTAVNADKASMDIVNGSLQDTFRINANYGAYEVERATGIDTSFTLYNKDAVADLIKNQPDLLPKPRVDIPLDKRWNRQHLNSAITQGILQGDSIDNIAKRLRSVANMDKNAAVRNARTMTTSAENAGAFHSYERAEKMGIKGQKMWMATHDSRTRDSHAMIDGETRKLDEKFSNDMMKPGDVEGRPEERYNCRCRIVYVSNRSQLKQYYDEQSKKVVIDGKSYDTWKQESYAKWTKRHKKKVAADAEHEAINLNVFANKLEDYVSGGYNLDSLLSDAEKEYIAKNSTEYNRPMYRLEDARYTADLIDNDKLDANDFKFNGSFRSFTRDGDVIKKMLDEGSDDYAGIYAPVVFETVGPTMQFNMDKYATEYAKALTDQKESLVGGKFSVIDEDIRKIHGEFIRFIKIKQIDF